MDLGAKVPASFHHVTKVITRDARKESAASNRSAGGGAAPSRWSAAEDRAVLKAALDSRGTLEPAEAGSLARQLGRAPGDVVRRSLVLVERFTEKARLRAQARAGTGGGAAAARG